MNKRKITKIATTFIAITIILSLCACNKSTVSKNPSLNTDFSGRQNLFTFAAQPSEKITLSAESGKSVLSVINAQQADYSLSYLYELDEVKKRLDFDASVSNHQFTALNESGELNASYFTTLVEENNKAYLAEHDFGYKSIEQDYLSDICDFIVIVIQEMSNRYPDVDWERVYCNLGNLKILYDVGMLSYAEVSDELVLSISKNNTEIALNLKGEDGFSRVLIHEIMHIIQIGCACENIENCKRRAGIAVYWDDFSLNTTDWTWMVEGAAERNMCNLTGGKAVSYQYKMDYLCSMTMSVLLRDLVKPDTMETLCFYSDPNLLFNTFGCKNQQQQDELLNMMITLQVLQMQPDAFYLVYKEATGIDVEESEETLNQFSYSLKPAVCITLTKEFYENLIPFLQQNQITCNDLFFLINLFEGHLNQHLTYTNESKKEINQPFITSYTAIREALFAALEADNPGIDISELYAGYNIIIEGESMLNAELSMLPEEKLVFLSERAQWQADLQGLGQKVPIK